MLFHEYEQTDVGKFVKSTKQMHKWTFTAGDGKHEVCLFESNVSGKVKVTFDGDTSLMKKVKEDVKKSGIQTSVPGYELFFVKLGAKWEFRVNFERFVEHKKAEKKALPVLTGVRKVRESEEQEDDVGDVLADLSPAPRKESPALSPIGITQKQKFFNSEICGYNEGEDGVHGQPNQFTFEDNEVEAGLQALPEDNLNFKKPVKATAEIDAWGQDNYAFNSPSQKHEQENSKSTDGMKGPESGEEHKPPIQTYQNHVPNMNPFTPSIDEFSGPEIPQTNIQPQRSSIWNTFQRHSVQQISENRASQNPFPSQYQKPIEKSPLNSKPEIDFLSTETTMKSNNLDIEAAKSASFVPLPKAPVQTFQKPVSNAPKGPIRLNFKKADDQVFFNKKTSTPELGSERTKVFFNATPNHQPRNNNSSKLLLPRPSDFEQTAHNQASQPSNWFPNFSAKQQPANAQKQPQNQPVSTRQQQTSWLGQQMVNSDFGRYSLQPSTERNVWRQQNTFSAPQFPQQTQQPQNRNFAAKTASQPLNRQSIMESAKRVDDDQFLNF